MKQLHRIMYSGMEIFCIFQEAEKASESSQNGWSSMEKNWTKGGVFKSIVFFSLPYLLSYFLQTLYGVADLFIIGQFTGSDMITAVSNGSQIMHMVTVIIVGLAMGATVTIGKAVGGDDLKGASSYIGNSVTLFLGLQRLFFLYQ